MTRVALVLLVVLAGCSGISGPAPTESGTVTPAPIPSSTATPMADQARLPDGVSVVVGITEPWDVTIRSAELLSNQSHTIHVREEARYANGSLRWRLDRIRRVADTRTYTIERHHGHDRPGWTFAGMDRVEIYTTDGRDPTAARAYWALTDDGETQYATFDAVGRSNRRQLFQLLSRFETRVTGRVTRHNTTMYRVEAESRGEPHKMKYVDRTERARNVSLSLLIDRRGLIHEWRVAYTVVADGREIRYVRLVRVTNIGTTTVDRPAWVSQLQAETPTTPDANPGASGADA